jgi:hypothetical protein
VVWRRGYFVIIFNYAGCFLSQPLNNLILTPPFFNQSIRLSVALFSLVIRWGLILLLPYTINNLQNWIKWFLCWSAYWLIWKGVVLYSVNPGFINYGHFIANWDILKFLVIQPWDDKAYWIMSSAILGESLGRLRHIAEILALFSLVSHFKAWKYILEKSQWLKRWDSRMRLQLQNRPKLVFFTVLISVLFGEIVVSLFFKMVTATVAAILSPFLLLFFSV